MEEIKHRGFIEPKPEDLEGARSAGYVLGAAGGVQAPDINALGDWTAVWPAPEVQSCSEANRFFDTNGCTLFHTLRPLRALMKFKYGKDFNWSERALGIAAGTDPLHGGDPFTVAETIRLKGLVPNADLPFSNDIMSAQQFYTPKPLLQRILDVMSAWVISWLFNHEQVFDPTDPIPVKHEKMRAALKKGTVAASVHAWKVNAEGLYWMQISGDAYNHWCSIKRYDGMNPIAGDTYDPFEKKLAADYNFGMAMVYYLNPQIVSAPGAAPTSAEKLIAFLLDLIAKLKAKIAQKNQKK